jgi:Ca2+-binding RTX toxin-like protein
MKIEGSTWGDTITPWSWFQHSTSEADEIYGYGGWDWLHGGGGDDTIFGGSGNDTIFGGSGSDQLRGGRGADQLDGGSGRDTVRGGSGDDLVDGGRGRDELTGGSGWDSFVFDTSLGSRNVDTITDFNAEQDNILLSQWVFSNIWAGDLQEEQFHAAVGANEGQDGDDRIIYDTASGSLYYDADGSGSGDAVRFAIVSGAPSLTAEDFVIV